MKFCKEDRLKLHWKPYNTSFNSSKKYEFNHWKNLFLNIEVTLIFGKYAQINLHKITLKWRKISFKIISLVFSYNTYLHTFHLQSFSKFYTAVSEEFPLGTIRITDWLSDCLSDKLSFICQIKILVTLPYQDTCSVNV